MPGSSPTARGRIEFVSYGLVVHFPLLSTPPRGDAVMFGFGPGFVGPERTCTSLIPRAPARTGTAVPGGEPSPNCASVIGPSSFLRLEARPVGRRSVVAA